jgi:succinoglycan biosynthesis transport protein ExoP
LATSLERRQQGEHFRILDPPSLPVKPYSPDRLKLCAIGLGVGLLLGSLVSAGTEMTDDRLYSEKDLKKLLPLDVISEIPEIATAGEAEKHRKFVLLGRAATGVEFVLILAGFAISYLRG